MSSITVIAASDLITNSRADINANFDSLLNNKIETSVLDTDNTLAANSDAKIASQKAVKAYVDAGGNTNASTTSKGIVQESTQSQTDLKTAVGGTGARLFTSPSTIFPPNFDNSIYGESSDASNPRGMSDNFNKRIFPTGTNSFGIIDDTTGYFATRAGTADYAASTRPFGMVIIGAYAYVGLTEATAPRVYRYAVNNLAAGGTLCTFSGQALAGTGYTRFTSDGTNFYFNCKAGNSANTYVISKYTISGTVFTYVSDITCGSTATETSAGFVVRASDGHIITYLGGDAKLRRYNSSGVLQATSTTGVTGLWGTNVAGAIFYLGFTDASAYVKYQRLITLP